jgi:chaperonin GroES
LNLKPLGDRVIIESLEAETVTASGIVLPDTAKEKPQRGRVLAVGDGRWDEGTRVPLDVSVGDEVIYSKYGGTEVKVDGDDVLILSEHDILAVVEGSAPAKAAAAAPAAAKPKRAKK